MSTPPFISGRFRRPFDVRLVQYIEVTVTQEELDDLLESGTVAFLDDGVYFCEFLDSKELPDWAAGVCGAASLMDIEEVRFSTNF